MGFKHWECYGNLTGNERDKCDTDKDVEDAKRRARRMTQRAKIVEQFVDGVLKDMNRRGLLLREGLYREPFEILDLGNIFSLYGSR